MITLTTNNATPGPLDGFNAATNYSNWLIASAPTISGFNAGNFNLNTNSFVGATGIFAIEQRSYGGGQGLFLTYTATSRRSGSAGPLSPMRTADFTISSAFRTSWRRRRPSGPVIETLASIHYMENRSQPRPDWITFWLLESRSPELTVELVQTLPAETEQLIIRRPLLAIAVADDLPRLRKALDAEVRAEQDKDRAYWEPLKREMEAFRRAERGGE